MSLVVPDVGELYILAAWIAGYAPANLRVRLYQNNYTPVQDTVIGDLTVATFSGYSQQAVTLGTPSESSHKARTQGTVDQVFTHNGGGTANTIYGYYVVDNSTGDLLWVERFGSSQLMTNSGDQITITIKLTADSEN